MRRPRRLAAAMLSALALAALAWACGGGGGRRQVDVYIWTNYLPDEVVREFERRTGIDAQIDTYASNEALLSKLQSGVANYDVVVPSDYMLKILVPQGLLRPLDLARLPHGASLDPRFLD